MKAFTLQLSNQSLLWKMKQTASVPWSVGKMTIVLRRNVAQVKMKQRCANVVLA